MARKSSLTDKQWSDIECRLLAGEKAASLAKEFSIDRAQISRKFSQQHTKIKHVANQIYEADVALKNLPVAQQNKALSLVDELKAISTHLAGAAKYGAITAHRLSGIASQQIDKLDDTDPTGAESMETLRGIAALTEVANKSAQTGLNLLSANKDAAKSANSTPSGLNHFYGESDS